jgi:uncharacterized protein (TIRG00374 family)
VWTAAAIGLAALLLYLALRGASWHEVASILRNAQLRFLGVAFVTGTLAYALRALRWKLVLSAACDIRFMPVFWASSAGYLGNNLLPARAGEVIRSAMVSANSELSQAYVLTTALVERAVDLAILLAFSALVVIVSARAPVVFFRAAAAMLAIVFAVVAILIVVPRTETFWRSALQRTRFSEPWRKRLLRMLEQVVLGMRAFHHRSRHLQFAVLTGVIWCLDACGAMLVGRSLRMDIPLEAAFVLLAGLALGSTIPSTPGYVGVFQFVTVTVLEAYGIRHSAGLTYSLVLQAAAYAVITFWGLIGIWRFRALRQVRVESRLVAAEPRER